MKNCCFLCGCARSQLITSLDLYICDIRSLVISRLYSWLLRRRLLLLFLLLLLYHHHISFTTYPRPHLRQSPATHCRSVPVVSSLVPIAKSPTPLFPSASFHSSRRLHPRLGLLVVFSVIIYPTKSNNKNNPQTITIPGPRLMASYRGRFGFSNSPEWPKFVREFRQWHRDDAYPNRRVDSGKDQTLQADLRQWLRLVGDRFWGVQGAGLLASGPIWPHDEEMYSTILIGRRNSGSHAAVSWQHWCRGLRRKGPRTG